LNCSNQYAEYQRAGGKWDNLLYYYAFNFQLIQEQYKQGKLRDQPFRRIPGYIKYDQNDESSKKRQDKTTGGWVDYHGDSERVDYREPEEASVKKREVKKSEKEKQTES